MAKYKVGDYIILSDVGIEILVSKYNIVRKNIKKLPRKVTSVIDINQTKQEVWAVENRTSPERSAEVIIELFRLATQTEIKEGEIKKIFLTKNKKER